MLHFLRVWLLCRLDTKQLFSSFYHSVNAPLDLCNQLESTPCDLTHEEAPMKRSGQTLLGQGGGGGGCLYVLLNLAHSLGHCGPFEPLDGASGSPFGPAHWQFSHNMWCHDDANLTPDVSWIWSIRLANWSFESWLTSFLTLWFSAKFCCLLKLGLDAIFYNSYFHCLRYIWACSNCVPIFITFVLALDLGRPKLSHKWLHCHNPERRCRIAFGPPSGPNLKCFAFPQPALFHISDFCPAFCLPSSSSKCILLKAFPGRRKLRSFRG